MAAKEISVKKYVVRLSGEERERLETLIRKGKSPARRLLKAGILLKADVSEAGKGWSDNRIIEALETSPSMVYRVRKQLVEEGFEAVLSRKPRAMPAVARIFDGEKEAKLIALACSKPPRDAYAGPCGCWRTKWENSAFSIVPATARSGARSKKHSSAPSPPALDHPAEGQQRVHSRYGRRAGRLHAATRRRLSAGLPRRDLEATRCRNARADSDESATPGPFRLRVRAQWHRQSLHDVCSARRLAPRQGHRSPYRGGLRSRLERLGRHPLRARQEFWSRTISASTARLHSTKPFRPSKPGAWSSASNGTTLQNTAAGSIWPSLNSIAAFPTNKSSSTKSPPGSTTAVPTTPRPTGNSPPKMLASNLSIYTLQSD